MRVTALEWWHRRRDQRADRRPRRQITEIDQQIRAGGADHPYVPLLLTAPRIGWMLAFGIVAEIGDIACFASDITRHDAYPFRGPAEASGWVSAPRCS
jgi:hypothetical protein